jgi:EmrB/QacA subfamily drug resistance transporter
MVVLDISIVNVALPAIGRDLDYSGVGLQWVVNAYVLTFAGFLLLGGRIADMIGRRRVFIAGLALFSLASLLGGLAQSSSELTIARAFQGLGGAVLSPATLTIIMTTFTEGEGRNRALGAWSAVAGLGGAFGVIMGGVLTSYLSWRWVFYVNIPIGVAAAIAAQVLLTESRRTEAERQRLDVQGSLLATGGLALLVYTIVGTDTHPWGSWRTLGLLAAAIVILAIFVVTQTRVREPLMPLTLFRSRSVSAANVVMLLLGVVFFSMWYFLSLYLQDVHGYGALKTGLLFLPMSVAIITGAQIAGRVLGRVGPQRLLVVGLGMSAGFAWLTQLNATSSYVHGVLGGTLLITFGTGLSFAPLATAGTSGVHWTQAGLASGVLNTSRQVGGSIGLAALATVATDRTTHLLGGHAAQAGSSGLAAALTSGYVHAFAAAAVIAAVGAVAALGIPSPVRVPEEAVPATS